MPTYLYRPVRWWRCGKGTALLPAGVHHSLAYEIAAALIMRGLATHIHTTFCGDSMTDDHSTRLTLITVPAGEPLTLAEAKTFLRIEHAADDALITRAVQAAREAAEQYIRCALLPQTWEYTVANPYRCEVRLPFGPAQSIISITATDSEGGTSILDSGTYALSVDGSMVLFVNTPSAEKIAIRYSASIAADAASLPALLKQGMLHHIAAMLEQREGTAPLPMQSIACYMPYRKIAL